jgi:hypothetical protein
MSPAMLSPLHEKLVELFRQRPSMALELLAGMGVALEPGLKPVPADSVLNQTRPAQARADLAWVLREGDESRLGLIVEVQLYVHEPKKWAWLLYAASLAVRLGTPAWVLVVAPEPAVAAWAAEPLTLGPPGSAFRPFVIGREAVPWVRDVHTARAAPELAVLSVLAHGAEPGGFEVALAAWEATAGLDPERATQYTDFIAAALPEALRRALEELMALRHYEYESELVRKWVLKGREEGLEKGREEGLEKGREEGLIRGKAEDVLAILAARGLTVSEDERQRILACTDLEVLGRWIVRAATAARVSELLE